MSTQSETFEDLITKLEADGWTVGDEGHIGLFLLGPDGEHAIIDSYDGGLPPLLSEMVGVTVGVYRSPDDSEVIGSAHSETDASIHMILETLDAALENARESSADEEYASYVKEVSS